MAGELKKKKKNITLSFLHAYRSEVQPTWYFVGRKRIEPQNQEKNHTS